LQTVCLSPNGLDTYDLSAPARRLLVGTTDGVFLLTPDDAGIWKQEGHVLQGHHVESLMVVPGTQSVFAGMHGSGFYRSRDGALTWSPVATDIGNIVFTLACVREADNMALYAGTEPAALFRSRDDGDSWQELPALRAVPSSSRWDFPPPPHIAHVKHVTADPRDSRILYVCVEQGALLKSFDGGESWIDLDYDDPTYRLNRDTHRIVFSPSNPDRIYLDGGDGIAMSEDAGQTWTRLATPAMRVAYPDQLFISPASDDTLFAVGGGTPPNIWRQTGNASTAIVRSDDRGRTWHHVGGGLPDGDLIQGNLEAATMIRWPGGFGFFAGSSDGEIFASVDEGKSWQLIASGLPSVSKGVHHANLLKGRAKALQTGATR
jgi:photosystem II stability/assembly factor-like uncharacterized protein